MSTDQHPPLPAIEPRSPRYGSLADLSTGQLELFQRHLMLNGFGAEAQLRLLNSTVVVVGAGGLGAPVLSYLAAAGVGRIEIVDDDVVDRSNLHRQVIHSEDRLGEPKTASAAEALRGLHPELEVVEHRVRLDRSNALELLGAADLVVDGSDNFLTRYLVADAAEILRLPLVYGAILRFSGQVSVFWSGHGPVYRDLCPKVPDPGLVPSCAEAGVLGVLPGVVGTLMAVEAIKVLAGIGDPLIGRVLVYEALTAEFREVRLEPDPARRPVPEVGLDLQALEAAADTACMWPTPPARRPEGADEDVDEIAPSAFVDLLKRPEAPLVVDVREEWEHRLGSVPGSVLVPLSVLEEGGGLPGPDVPDGAEVVVHCKSGARSRRAVQILRGTRPEVRWVSLAGGLDAVAGSVDR